MLKSVCSRDLGGRNNKLARSYPIVFLLAAKHSKLASNHSSKPTELPQNQINSALRCADTVHTTAARMSRMGQFQSVLRFAGKRICTVMRDFLAARRPACLISSEAGPALQAKA